MVFIIAPSVSKHAKSVSTTLAVTGVSPVLKCSRRFSISCASSVSWSYCMVADMPLRVCADRNISVMTSRLVGSLSSCRRNLFSESRCS